MSTVATEQKEPESKSLAENLSQKNKTNPSIQSEEPESQSEQALTEQKDTDRPAESTQTKLSEPRLEQQSAEQNNKDHPFESTTEQKKLESGSLSEQDHPQQESADRPTPVALPSRASISKLIAQFNDALDELVDVPRKAKASNDERRAAERQQQEEQLEQLERLTHEDEAAGRQDVQSLLELFSLRTRLNLPPRFYEKLQARTVSLDIMSLRSEMVSVFKDLAREALTSASTLVVLHKQALTKLNKELELRCAAEQRVRELEERVRELELAEGLNIED